jgi:hypothetical protein
MSPGQPSRVAQQNKNLYIILGCIRILCIFGHGPFYVNSSTMLLDKIINTVFSLGAAIVIFGAWGKLENKEFGSTALTAGLLTETGIFFLYGILEWRRRPTPGAGSTDAQGQLAEARNPQSAEIGRSQSAETWRPQSADPRGPRTGEHPSTEPWTTEHPNTAPWSAGHSNIQPRTGSPVHKEDLEALTGSIRETANLLSRIFRV